MLGLDSCSLLGLLCSLYINFGCKFGFSILYLGRLWFVHHVEVHFALDQNRPKEAAGSQCTNSKWVPNFYPMRFWCSSKQIFVTWKDASPVHSELPLLLVYTWCQLGLAPCERTWEKYCLANKSRWKGFPLSRVCCMKCRDELDVRALEPIDRLLNQIPCRFGWIYCRRGLSIWEWCWDRGRWKVVEMAHRIGVSRSSLGAQGFEYVRAISLEIWHLRCSTGCLINPRIWVLDILGACRRPEQ